MTSLQVAYINFNHISPDKIQHMVPTHPQGIPGNIVFLFAQEKKMEFIDIEQVTQRKKNKLHNDKVLRFPSKLLKVGQSFTPEFIYMYISFLPLRRKLMSSWHERRAFTTDILREK